MKTEEEITARLGQSVVVLGLLCITLAAIIVMMLNNKYTTDVEMAACGTTKPPVTNDLPPVKYKPGPDGIDGQKLFKQNCGVCHSTTTVDGTGPGLAGVITRVPSVEWMHSWIKNADAVKKSRDEYAVKIDKEFPSANMNVFSYLSDAEIDAIIDYIEAETK